MGSPPDNETINQVFHLIWPRKSNFSARLVSKIQFFSSFGIENPVFQLIWHRKSCFWGPCSQPKDPHTLLCEGCRAPKNDGQSRQKRGNFEWFEWARNSSVWMILMWRNFRSVGNRTLIRLDNSIQFLIRNVQETF